MPSLKLQAPSSNLQRNFKQQTPRNACVAASRSETGHGVADALDLGAWSFSGAWSLELGASACFSGAWCLVLGAFLPPPIPSAPLLPKAPLRLPRKELTSPSTPPTALTSIGKVSISASVKPPRLYSLHPRRWFGTESTTRIHLKFWGISTRTVTWCSRIHPAPQNI